MSSRITQTSDTLGWGQLLSYSGVALTLAIMMDPIPTILFQFYAQHTAATLAGIGTVLFVSRFIDALTDPLIGVLSDRTRSRLGPRKPWLIAGGLLAIPGTYLFFNPSADSGVLYFAIGCNIYYLCRTMILIPFSAWGSEITRDYDERSRLGAWFSVLLLLAQLFFMAFPVLASSPLLPLFTSAELGPEMVSAIGWIGIALMPLSIGCAVAFAPSGRTPSAAMRQTALRDYAAMITQNKPFQLLMVSKAIGTMGFLVFFSVSIIAMDSYLRLGPQVPIILVSFTLAQIASIPLWRVLGTRIGKHRCMVAGWVLQAVLLPLVFFIEPGPAAFAPFMVLGVLVTVAQAPAIVFGNAVLSDVVDFDLLQSGTNRAGNYFALDAFLQKCVGAIAGSTGFWLLAWYGYDPKIAANTEAATNGLLITLAVVPGVLMMLGALLLWFFPIDARRHEEIRRGIESRLAGAQSTNGPG